MIWIISLSLYIYFEIYWLNEDINKKTNYYFDMQPYNEKFKFKTNNKKLDDDSVLHLLTNLPLYVL